MLDTINMEGKEMKKVKVIRVKSIRLDQLHRAQALGITVIIVGGKK